MIYQLCACSLQKVPKACGIYEIHDEYRTASYIGSTINFKKRAHDHFRRLFKDVHPNKKLQRFFHKKRGILFFRIHHVASPSALKRLEQLYLDMRRPGLNRTKTANYHVGRFQK